MRFLVDLDGVVIDNMATQLALTNAKFGTAFTPADLRSWDTAETTGADIAAWLWGADCFLHPAVQASMTPVAGAMESLAALRRAGDTLFYCTDRPHELYPATRAWLLDHGLREPLIFARPRGKADVALDLGIDYALDDAPHHITGLARVVGSYALLWDAPYNRFAKGQRIVRVSGWHDVMTIAEGERVSRRRSL